MSCGKPWWWMMCVMVVLGWPSVGWSNPFDVYGAGTRGAAMGGAQVASSEGAAAIYDNVAGLARQRAELRAGAFATFADAPILLKERPAGYDVPDVGGETQALPSNQTQRERSDSEGPGSLFGVTVGVVTDFGGTKTRGGVLVMLPTNGLMELKTHFSDERERYFSNQLHHEIVGSGLHRPVIELGLARELTSWLAFGVGGTYLPGAAVGTHAYLADPSDQSQVVLNADVVTTNDWGLLAGVLATLPGGFELGLAYRGEVAFVIEGGNEIQLRGVDAPLEERRQEIKWVPLSTPSSLRAGLAWGTQTVEVSLDGRYTLWSSYVDSQGNRAEFSNRLEGRAGVEWASSEDTRLRAGVGFVPSPVPAQTGRTNYVDNSRLLASVGGSHGLSFSGREFEASWFVQFQHLLRRETDKEVREVYPSCGSGEVALCDEVADDLRDPLTGQPYAEAQGLQTGNPGFPGFVSGGWIGALGFELRY